MTFRSEGDLLEFVLVRSWNFMMEIAHRPIPLDPIVEQ